MRVFNGTYYFHVYTEANSILGLKYDITYTTKSKEGLLFKVARDFLYGIPKNGGYQLPFLGIDCRVSAKDIQSFRDYP